MVIRNEGKYENNDGLCQDCGKFWLTDFAYPSLSDAPRYLTKRTPDGSNWHQKMSTFSNFQHELLNKSHTKKPLKFVYFSKNDNLKVIFKPNKAKCY